MRARVYIHLKTDINLERSTGCTASVQLSLCIHWLWWDCWLCEDCFIKSFMNSYRGKPEASPLSKWAKTRLCWKWCRALVQGRRVSWLPPFSWKENPQAAASFRHTQLLLLQSVTSLVNPNAQNQLKAATRGSLKSLINIQMDSSFKILLVQSAQQAFKRVLQSHLQLQIVLSGFTEVSLFWR